MMTRVLHFGDLEPCPDGAFPMTYPPELVDEWSARTHTFLMNGGSPAEPLHLVGFVARKDGQRRALAMRLSDLYGTPEENRAAIEANAPEGWSVEVRTATV